MIAAAAAAVVAKLPLLLLLSFLCLHEGLSFSYLAHSQSHQCQCRHQHQHNRHQSTSRWRWRIYHRPDDVNNKGIVDIDLRFHPNKLFNNIIVSEQKHQQYRRRNVLWAVATKLTAVAAAAATTSTVIPFLRPNIANAAVGSLPEFSNTNAILQSITIDTIDKSQFDETIAFFTGGAFEGMKLLREKNIASSSGGGDDKNGMVQEAWIGFGPEMLSIPPTFTLPVSSFAEYGGHASIHVRYDPQQFLASSSSSTEIPLPQYYQRSSGEYNNAPPTGDNIAYLQLGVPTYRISQMVKNYGNILDAYGWVNVISPCGLPVRAIVGIRPDPIMFLAINCLDVKKSEEFYYEQLGFVRQEYPYARPNQGQGQFEPPQPPKSVYIGPSPNCMGILLLQNKNRRKPIVPNPTLRSLNVVYAPAEGGSSSGGSIDDDAGIKTPKLLDLSSVPISFMSQDYLESQIKSTSM